MDSQENLKGIVSVLRAYSEVFAWLGASVMYLLYLAAGTLTGLIDLFAFSYLPFVPAVILAVLGFVVLFAVTSRLVSVLQRLLIESRTERPEKSGAGNNRFIPVFWIIIFAAILSMSYYFYPVYYAYTIGVSLSLGVGNIFTGTVTKKRTGDIRTAFPVAMGVYLVLSSPIYLVIPNYAGANVGFVEFSVMLFNIIGSYFATALYFLYVATSSVKGILHEGQ